MRSRLWSAVAALLILMMSPGAVRAEWLRAESERFIVYSDSDERVLRSYVQNLETFDRVLRFRTGLPMDAAPPRSFETQLYPFVREAALRLPAGFNPRRNKTALPT